MTALNYPVQGSNTCILNTSTLLATSAATNILTTRDLHVHWTAHKQLLLDLSFLRNSAKPESTRVRGTLIE